MEGPLGSTLTSFSEEEIDAPRSESKLKSQNIPWSAQAQNLALFFTLSPSTLGRSVISFQWPTSSPDCWGSLAAHAGPGSLWQNRRVVQEESCHLEDQMGPRKGSEGDTRTPNRSLEE